LYGDPQTGVVRSVADPGPSDPYVFGPPGSGSVILRYGSGSFRQPARKVRKTLIFYYFVSYDFFFIFYL
jgi:hypothetical protein